MAAYAVTFGMRHGIIGATESYIMRADTETVLVDRVGLLIGKRNFLMHSSSNWTGVRITQVPDPPVVNTVRQRSSFFKPGTHTIFGIKDGLTVPSNGAWPLAATGQKPDQGRACLQMRLQYAGGRETTRYLAFVPDGTIGEGFEQANKNAVGLWWDRFESFRDTLVNGEWAIKARKQTGTALVTLIKGWFQSEGAPLNMGFILPSAGVPTFSKGDLVHIRNVRRKGTDQLSYNGKYYIDVYNPNFQTGFVSYTLKATESGVASSIKRHGTVQLVEYEYLDITGLDVKAAGVHKRGKPLGGVRGRSSNKQRLDP